MEDLKLVHVSLETGHNHLCHKTGGLSFTSLVVRRGQVFQLKLTFNRPYVLNRDYLGLRFVLDPLFLDIPITAKKVTSGNQWSVYFEDMRNTSNKVSMCVYTPANAIVGVYAMHLHFLTQRGSPEANIGQFTLLCNPWCLHDSVYLLDENQREEYVRNDSGLLYKGTHKNIIYRSWGYDQYENGILEICMMMLQVSNEHKRNLQEDYFNRADPAYISRVISAMINSHDDCGVLQGNWSEDYSSGVSPTEWTDSGSILKQWAKYGCRPVKYGQCWVFAAVMCTVMRVLGIPTRVVTNFNSAHDTNGNLVIEEYYTERGEKLPHHGDSIWNFHLWVECWMKRRDLGAGFDGWQVVDPTPQERSRGVYRCGPAPVKAIRNRQMYTAYDVPFIYAAVNADVQVCIMRQMQVIGCTTDTTRVGSLICTKSLGSSQPENITSTYKQLEAAVQPTIASSDRSTSPRPPDISSHSSAKGLSAQLNLSKIPVFGESISFSVTVTNQSNIQKTVKEYINAQGKAYDHSPSSTFMEASNIVELAPYESKMTQHQIAYSEYAALDNEKLVNLAAVITDVATEERVLASEEFNFTDPVIHIQVANEDAIVVQRDQAATVTFTNLFSVAVKGRLTVAGSGLLKDKVIIDVNPLQPGETMHHVVSFTPYLDGEKMLHASLSLDISHVIVRGFKTFRVHPE